MQTQEAVGTVAYMAPEQLRRKARPASDQYALGVMVYEWLSGELPFEGAPIEVALQHLTEPPPSLREKNPNISPAIEQVVLKALAKDPQQRNSDELAFAEALESASMAVVPEQPASSFPYEREFTGREARYGRRKDPPSRARVALLASLALVVILSAGTFSLFELSRHQGSMIVTGSISTPGTLSTSLPPTITPNAPLPGSANWSMYGFDAQHSQFNPYEKMISLKNVPDLAQAWVTRIIGGIGFTPTIANNILYITGGGPTLYALDTRTEAVIWKTSLPKTSLQPIGYASYIYSPTVVNGIMYLASDFDALGAFDARTGKLL